MRKDLVQMLNAVTYELEKTPKEQIENDLDSIKHFREVGISAEEWLTILCKQNDEHRK